MANEPPIPPRKSAQQEYEAGGPPTSTETTTIGARTASTEALALDRTSTGRWTRIRPMVRLLRAGQKPRDTTSSAWRPLCKVEAARSPGHPMLRGRSKEGMVKVLGATQQGGLTSALTQRPATVQVANANDTMRRVLLRLLVKALLAVGPTMPQRGIVSTTKTVRVAGIATSTPTQGLAAVQVWRCRCDGGFGGATKMAQGSTTPRRVLKDTTKVKIVARRGIVTSAQAPSRIVSQGTNHNNNSTG